jgi:hypothetical protein
MLPTWLSRVPQRAGGALRGVGERIGMGLERRLATQTGRQFGDRARASAVERAQLDRAAVLAAERQAAARTSGRGVSAARVGEADGQTVADAISSGRNAQPRNTPGGTVGSFSADGTPRVLPPQHQGANVGLEPFEVGGYPRAGDAEIRAFGLTLATTTPESTGAIYLGVTAPMCPSCTAGLWRVRAMRPDLQFITNTPWSVPNVTAGIGGASSSVMSRPDEPPPVAPVLEFRLTF